MSFKAISRDIIYKIDSSEKTNIVLATFQALATASAVFYTIYADTQIARWCIYSFTFFQLMVLLFFAGMLLISGKYRAIKLRLNRNTGVLYDATTNFRNVSLRDESLNNILDSIGDSEKTYKIGKEVGEKFFASFEGELQRTGKSYDTKDKLKKWLEYDSSSGMGKFEVIPQTGLLTKLKIISPFIGDCPSQKPNTRCRFLMGYIDGFCSKLYGDNIKSKCKRNPDPPFCILTLEPAN